MGAGLLACLGTLLILLSGDLTGLTIGAGLVVVGAVLFATASWALATDLAAPGKGAFYLGIANGATVLGSIGGRLGGPVIDGFNQLAPTGWFADQQPGYWLVFGLASLFFAASSATMLKIPAFSRAAEKISLPK